MARPAPAAAPPLPDWWPGYEVALVRHEEHRWIDDLVARVRENRPEDAQALAEYVNRPGVR